MSKRRLNASVILRHSEENFGIHLVSYAINIHSWGLNENSFLMHGRNWKNMKEFSLKKSYESKVFVVGNSHKVK